VSDQPSVRIEKVLVFNTHIKIDFPFNSDRILHGSNMAIFKFFFFILESQGEPLIALQRVLGG
jgi:hypothetical protein